MEVKSTYKYARISAFKAREVAREIQGLSVSDALDLMRFTPKKAARLIEKTLKSAVANAEHNNELKPEDLVVKEATIGEGPTIRRFATRARGSSSLIRKRTSHIRIILSDEAPAKPEKSTRRARPANKRRRTTESAPSTESTPSTVAAD